VASHKPALESDEKSDTSVVPAKGSNATAGAVGEALEGRGVAEGNAGRSNAHRTQGRAGASQGLAGVREAARRDRRLRFTALLHHVTPQLLTESYYALSRGAAAGVDGVSWAQYGEGLAARIAALHRAVHEGSYRAQPSRRSYIPKADGSRRPLGIAALEDKIVQQALVSVLGAVYEEEFLGFSYAFRPGRSQHDALDALSTALMSRKVNWIIDADITAFFDSIDHEWMLKMLDRRIGDRRVLRLIAKWLKVGVVEDGRRIRSEQGTPQGAVISPLLANIFLHYGLDLWVQRWRRREATGQVIVTRYADDVIVGFEHRTEAQRFLREAQARLTKFGLALHPTKTRLLEFGRYAAERRARRGEGKPATFDFLGFTHCCSRTRGGAYTVRRLTVKKRLRATVQAVRAQLNRRRHEPVGVIGRWLRQVVQGYFNYFAVPGNLHRLRAFRRAVGRAWRQALRRRSQRGRLPWQRFAHLLRLYLPPVRQLHPYPLHRFDVTHPRQEPYAVIPPVRICAGGAG